jgi:Ca2+-binding RTX toxin-like protein
MASFSGTDGADTIIPGFVSLNVSGTGTPGDDSDTIFGNNGADLLDGGGGDDYLNGAAGANTLIGGAGDDTLDPGSATDRLEGGSGNDLYLLGAAAQVVVELADDGIDTGLFNYENGVLPDNVENGQLEFTFVTLSGNALDNWLIGNGVNNVLNGAGGHDSLTGLEGADTLSGDAGADTLDGGNGADRLSGGADNDVYLADSTDTLLDSGGMDTVRIASSHSLGADFENLVLLGGAALTGTGNASANLMVANDAGNTLIGNEGADTLLGGTGNDSLAGNQDDDRLEGGDGADTLNGFTNNDTMIGGSGDDLFVVGQSADVVVEEEGGGIDTVFVPANFLGNYVLPDHVEHLTLLGGLIARTGTGNALDNAITGDAAFNELNGLDGADTLDGGAAPDLLFGGLGNDVYVVDDLGDVVSEAGGDGLDLVRAGVAFTLGADIENLTLTGGGGIAGTGNGLANLITGDAGADTLRGLDGADTLVGGNGADSLVGGADNDVYFADDGDLLLDSGGVDTVWFLSNHTLGADFENLVLHGGAALTGTGNALANLMVANDAGNTLSGNEGADTLRGGVGNDSLAGNQDDDRLEGGDGADTLNGLTDNDTLIGGAGDDVLIIGQPGDMVIEEAGGGTDTVRVTFIFGGTYLLPDHVEHLVLLGANTLAGNGNALDNAITGNSAANALSGLDGADTLDGAGGADSLVGGLGNDVYVVNDLGDVVSEAGGDGVDLVLSGVSFTLGAGLEKLTLTGGGGIAGTGNGLANLIIGNGGSNELAGGGAADTLIGQGGNDRLNGGAGADSMVGGGNSDRYTVDNIGDVVVEEAVAGVDVVLAFVDWTLGENAEQLNLLGMAVQGFGNGLANRIAGNAGDNLLQGFAGNDRLLGGDGADTLAGGPGRDAMTGGLGADRFLFDAPDEGADVIDDFAPGVDRIVVSGATFGGLAAGQLDALNFVAHASNATTAAAGVPQFIYNTTNGTLSFDADGAGGDPALRLVTLIGAPALAATDFVLV